LGAGKKKRDKTIISDTHEASWNKDAHQTNVVHGQRTCREYIGQFDEE
jgi:hypothetical protein